MKRLRLLEAAAEEAIAAAAWYEHERPGLGAEFAQAINAALDLIEEAIVPLSPAPRIPGTKRLVLRRFPYDVIVREQADEIVIVAIAHHSRRPGYWRGRLPG